MFVAEDMYQLGSQRSAIRELFEYGKQRAAVVGAENVFFPRKPNRTGTGLRQ